VRWPAEIHHLVPAIVKDQRAPILVRPLPRVLMLVKRRAIEPRQRPVVAWEMGGHPVNNDANTRFVQRIDEELEILRLAVAAGRREEPVIW